MRGVARLDPASIIVTGLLLGGVYLLTVYSRRYLVHRRRKPSPRRSVRVSDARLYSRYGEIAGALEEVGVTREGHETPEEYARRAAERLNEPGVARLGEIYLYARFRDAVPAEMVEEFDRLEPDVFMAVERVREESRIEARSP